MNIAIVGDLISFPHGFAATARTISMGKGLLKSGARVHVLSLNSADGTPLNPFGNTDPAPGVFEGISYSYPRLSVATLSPASQSIRHRIGRRLTSSRSSDNLGHVMEKHLRGFVGSSRLDAMIVATRSAVLHPSILEVARAFGSILIMQSCESPVAQISDIDVRKRYTDLVVREYDAIEAISDYLRQYWVDLGFDGERVTIGPSPVDTDFFHVDAQVVKNRLVYVGQVAHQEAWDLIDIMHRIRREVPDAHLLLVGPGAEDKVASVKERILQLDLEGHVTLTGPVARTNLPDLYATAQLLLLPRTSGEYSSAGLPNKLGEYLSTGRPAVLTSVGEIGSYVEDGVTARLVAPGDPGAFAEAGVQMLREPERAETIGRAGRSVAVEFFSEEAFGRRMMDFVEQLSRRPKA